MKFTIGSDPEFMIINSKGQVKSAINILKSPKQKPIQIEQNKFYYDNVLAECTIQPSLSKEEFIDNIKKSLKNLSHLIKPYELKLLAACKFPKEELIHPDSYVVGCDPEICAYSMKVIETQKFENDIRTAGGHIHLEFNFAKTQNGPLFSTRILDLFLGIISNWMDKDPSTSIRKKMCGKAGRFRIKEYGLEYRTLSNFWFASPQLVSVIYDIIDSIVSLLENNGYFEYWDFNENNIDWNKKDFNMKNVHICKEYNVDMLRNTIDKNIISKEFNCLIEKHLSSKLLNEIQNVINNNYNFYKEWEL